mmetsp:Transcript_61082/g.71453  ORF Transcript_61082/g.71453 Transcript_61082/m.71453 type:complete len:309 (-) Transcript_61082:621-1547(-)
MTSSDLATTAPQAFFLVIAAGSATSLGASVIFSPRLLSLTSKRGLAACLGAAAGVMLYVAFLDIFTKCVDAYGEGDREYGAAYALATATFFVGFGVYAVLHRVVQWLNPQADDCCGADFLDAKPAGDETAENSLESGEVATHTPPLEDTHSLRLKRTGLMTATAVAIHNLPEGLVTFVAYTADPTIGISLAIAIAVHNVPEGLCVAVPIYYATGNRWKAFGVATASGLSEVLGGGLGWIVLASSNSGEGVHPDVYGALFGLVGGLMVVIGVCELLPAAHKYDPEDTLTTKSVVFGMAVMALSLVLLNL